FKSIVNTFTSHQFTLTPVASTTVHDINANVINDGSFSGFSNESLPVELVSLQGRKHNESIKIDWETAMEEQNEGFYVERSYNGLEFEQIDFIPGNGFSTEAILYEYLDHHFDQSAEVVYYRLKQLDFDGKIEYSHVISVRNKNIDDDGSLEISVFPNPANSEVIITASDKVNLRVLGTSGNVLFESYNANGALVDLSAFAKGFYIVEAFSDDNSVIKREKLIVE
ncbi:MAG: T9SS type A sorting domain-containing protein, partial [Bacteroidetes bacterium]|nr:T9SS type A sorting domain-containing protein [Bacteroidota bacterium]